MAKLDDRSPFPFGKAHKGKPMEKVPVRYFHWVWEECDQSEDVDDVRDYIIENFSALKMEDKKLIWSKFGAYRGVNETKPLAV